MLLMGKMSTCTVLNAARQYDDWILEKKNISRILIKYNYLFKWISIVFIIFVFIFYIYLVSFLCVLYLY